MTIALIIVAVYVAGTFLGARMWLQHLMNRPVCTGKGSSPTPFLDLCQKHHARDCIRPVGETRPRTLVDGCHALGVGLGWPVLLLAAAVTASTPPTPGEARRRLAEQESRLRAQAAEIDRLHALIADG